MARHTLKGKRFEVLIKKADNALEQEFCIEASSIYYALIEERLYSLLDLIGVDVNQNKEKVYHCIRRILNIIDNGHYIEDNKKNSVESLIDVNIRRLITKQFDRELFIRLDKWRQKRNRITHDFAKIDMDYIEIVNYAKEGESILRELLSSQQRFKKKFKKL